MKTIIIGLLLLNVIVCDSYSQTTTFQSHCGDSTYEVPVNVFITPTGYETISLKSINNNQSIVFTSWSNIGSVIQRKIFNRIDFHLVVGYPSNRPACKTIDGSFLLPVMAVSTQFSNYKQIGLMKVNNNWDSLWTRYFFTDTAFMEMNQIRVDSDGNYIIVGNLKRDSALNYTAPLDLNILFVKTDTAGTILKYNVFGTNGYDGGMQIAELSNEKYICYGYTYGFAPDSISFFNRGDGYLCLIDSNGSFLSHYRYGRPLGSDLELCFFLQKNNNCFYTGGAKGAFDLGSDYGNKWLMKLDSNFQVTKEILLGQIGQSVIVDFINNYKGNYIGLSNKSESLPTIYRRSAELFEMDIQERICWYRKVFIADTSFTQIFIPGQILATPDSGYAFIGTGQCAEIGLPQSSTLIKTDSLGCDGFLSCTDTAIVVEILNYPDTLCQNDTNFIEVRLKGRSAPYSLFANDTIALDSIFYPYTLPLWIDTVMPFYPVDTGWQPLIVTLHEPWERTASDTVQVYVKNCATSYASHEFYERKVEVFPNPATTELHVKIRGLIEGAYSISMYDTQGKTIEIITTKEQETVIDISKYPQGIYWVRVLGNNVVRSEKVIILKND